MPEVLFLVFQIGKERYALEAKCVVEVIPLLTLKQVPQGPPGLAGLVNYRGQPIPALDLSLMVLGRPAAETFSTRIIIVRCTGPNAEPRLLGLIAEQATGILRKHPDEFVKTGLEPLEKPFLGPVLMDPGGPIQWVREEQLLCKNVRQLAFELVPPVAT